MRGVPVHPANVKKKAATAADIEYVELAAFVEAKVEDASEIKGKVSIESSILSIQFMVADSCLQFLDFVGAGDNVCVFFGDSPVYDSLWLLQIPGVIAESFVNSFF